MSATPTPGPWFREAHGTRGSLRIATVCHGRNHHGDGPEGTVCEIIGAKEADERLMIAAPEMLEAIGPAITQLSFAAERAANEGDEVALRQIHAALMPLRRALAKAREGQ